MVGRVACSNSARYCFLDSSADWKTTRVVVSKASTYTNQQTSNSNLGLVFINLHRPVSGTFSRLGRGSGQVHVDFLYKGLTG